MKQCVKCESFKVVEDYEEGVDFGKARCKKHDLVAYFTRRKQLQGLTCVEEKYE